MKFIGHLLCEHTITGRY